MLSQTEENYLKAIYSIGISNGKNINTTLISRKLKTKPSSVTDMIRKLAEKDLIYYEKYKGVSLTQSGKKIAIDIVRKHRLWEVFLVNKLNYNWDEVHEMAEQLEHIKSDTLVGRLEAFLDFPKHDPHGDPIPDENGNIAQHKNVMLSSLEINSSGVVIGVKDSSSSFLQFLDNSNIKLGDTIKVIAKEDYDNSILIENKLQTKSISQQISANLFVKKI
ncbi:MAG: metal-dependent transcriptional regulator [Lutibacter sp.]|uniref:metal-dependent transcriptional regulator n=1 Tax=Lutibacter sp. TaxID=1925666 RepID=UPI001813426C|nr:metal-dependent transcriptional regulator [Lutibacter sp.]MBT8318017.1 metal-dependent transcriptional regulator [Lutibacter sp.]NNJ58876.1 metal-dependent transcriptional regulator [Lutibacter sp.]